MNPAASRPRVSQGRVLYGLAWPGRRSPQTGMPSTAIPITGTITHRKTLFRSPRLRSLTHSTISAMLAARYMITRPRIPYVDRKLDAVPGSVNAVEITPMRMLGATKATAAIAGVRNRGEIAASDRLHSPPRAPAKITREVWVFAATYELVTLDRKIQVMSGATNGMNAFAAVRNGFGSAASAPAWFTPNAITSA